VAFAGAAATPHRLVPVDVERWRREGDASSRRRSHRADTALVCSPETLRIEAGGSPLRAAAIGAPSGAHCASPPAPESSELLAPAPAALADGRRRSAGSGRRRSPELTGARGFAAKLGGPASAFAPPRLRLRRAAGGEPASGVAGAGAATAARSCHERRASPAVGRRDSPADAWEGATGATGGRSGAMGGVASYSRVQAGGQETPR
jgi:hypothetical protein